MNTRKHLKILYQLITILLVLSVGVTIISIGAMIADEGVAPFLICAILSLSLYFSMVFLSVIIDFYDAVVAKHQTLNMSNTDFINSQKQ